MLHFQRRRKFIKIPSGLKTLQKNEAKVKAEAEVEAEVETEVKAEEFLT